MRRKPYPKLTYERAVEAAEVYLVMRNSDMLIWRTTDFTSNSRSKGYKRILQALHRLEDNNIVGNTTIGDAGNIWWLNERIIPREYAR